MGAFSMSTSSLYHGFSVRGYRHVRKEELAEFWQQDSREEAEAFLLDWILQAESIDIHMLHQRARTLRFHANGLLACYDYVISPGPPERHQQQDQDHETSSLWLP
jgi:transposase